MHILYIGDSDSSSTACHRSHALERLGHSVDRLNPWTVLDGRRPSRVDYHTGYRFLQHRYKKALQNWLINQSENARWNLVWVDSGEWFGPGAVQLLKQLSGSPVVLYQIDDCTGRRDWQRFASLRKALPLYELCVTVRASTELEMRAIGARRTLRVWMSHDEIAHQASAGDHNKLSPCISFIGTLIPGEGRDRFLIKLHQAGIPLALWGSRWSRSPHWKALKSSYHGTFLRGSDLTAAMVQSAACLGLLSRGNRDLHTTRSLEVPYAGGLLCARRTSEHALLYDEGQEALFWSDGEECRRQCHWILSNLERAQQIRLAGSRRIRRQGIGNEDICRQILAHVEGC
jgi:spore maturation protein CgeB